MARTLAGFACYASLVLSCLPTRRTVRNFISWGVLPASIALAAFSTFLIVTTQQRNAAFDAFANAVRVPLPATRAWFPTLGQGAYLTLSALVVLAIGLILVNRQVISLPLRFPDAVKIATADHLRPSLAARDILIFLVIMVVLGSAISWGLVLPALLGKTPITWVSRSFTVIQWAPALFKGIAAACLAFFLLRTERSEVVNRLGLRRPFRDYAVALAIPLGAVLVPRFLLGVVFAPYLEPSEWPKLFLPHPLPWVLMVYIIAFFEEFAVRGYLQTALEEHFSLRRSIFLTALLWSLVLGFGVAHSLPLGALAKIPGVTLLMELAAFVIFSVPLGWLYARTRSIVATALMHGTIVVFHVGLGYDVHLNHPAFYPMELALWVFTGWLLFKRSPPETANRTDPAEPLVF